MLMQLCPGGSVRRFPFFRGPGRAGARERGSALIELVAVTAPISILCLVIASTLYSTASTRLASRARADLETQTSTTRPCAGPSMEAAAWSAESPIKSLITYPIAKLGLSITETDYRTVSADLSVRDFPFQAVADRMLPTRPTQVQSRITYLCNEPDQGDSRRSSFEIPLSALGTATATGLY